MVEDNDIGSSLQTVFGFCFETMQHFFCSLKSVFSYFLPFVVEVNIEIIGLIELPFFLFVLNSVFSESYCVNLRFRYGVI